MEENEWMEDFFNEQDFAFAHNDPHQDGSAEKSTKLNVIMFSDQISEDGEIAGVVTIRVFKSLKAGSVFLRLETVEELNLSEADPEESLAPLLHRLRPEIPAGSTILHSRKEGDEERGELMSTPVTARDITSVRDPPKSDFITSIHKSSKKFSSVAPATTKRLRDINCSVYYLAPERVLKPRISTTIEKMIFDVEIFTLDSETSNNPILIIPFRTELKGALLKTCSVNLDQRTYVALSKEKKKTARIITEKAVDRPPESKITDKQSALDPPAKSKNSALNQVQTISLKHFATCYYVPKTELLVYNKQMGAETTKIRQRKKYFEAIPSSIMGSREIQIYPNFKSLDYKTHDRKGQAYVVQENPNFLCCTKKLNLEVNICVDLINLRNQDTTLNFVMCLDTQILNDFPFLDVVIYSRMTRRNPNSSDSSSTVVTHFVNLVDSFDLVEKLPPTYKEKTIEFVRELNISPLVGRQQTVQSFNVRMEFFAEFYLSPVAQRFEQELIKIPLSFWKVGKETKFLDKHTNSLKFSKLEKFVDGFNKEDLSKRAEITKTQCIILPYAVFEISIDIDKDTGTIKAEQI